MSVQSSPMPTDLSVHLDLRISPADRARLVALAAEAGVSASEWLRMCIRGAQPILAKPKRVPPAPNPIEVVSRPKPELPPSEPLRTRADESRDRQDKLEAMYRNAKASKAR